MAIASITDSIATAIPVASDHCHALPAILVIAHIAMAGALMTTCIDKTISICTCMTSFVERVMRLAVEKEFISSMENDSTFSNIALRSLLEKLAAIDEARKHTATDEARLPSEQSSILPPADQMSAMALPSVSTSFVICDI